MQLVSSMITDKPICMLKQAMTLYNIGKPAKLLTRIHAKGIQKVCAPVDMKQSTKRQQQCNCMPHRCIVAGHVLCDQAVPLWQCPHELVQSVKPQPYDTIPWLLSHVVNGTVWVCKSACKACNTLAYL